MAAGALLATVMAGLAVAAAGAGVLWEGLRGDGGVDALALSGVTVTGDAPPIAGLTVTGEALMSAGLLVTGDVPMTVGLTVTAEGLLLSSGLELRGTITGVETTTGPGITMDGLEMDTGLRLGEGGDGVGDAR